MKTSTTDVALPPQTSGIVFTQLMQVYEVPAGKYIVHAKVRMLNNAAEGRVTLALHGMGGTQGVGQFTDRGDAVVPASRVSGTFPQMGVVTVTTMNVFDVPAGGSIVLEGACFDFAPGSDMHASDREITLIPVSSATLFP